MTDYRLPEASTRPRAYQAYSAIRDRRAALRRMQAEFGSAFVARFPGRGEVMFLSDPEEIRELFKHDEMFGRREESLGRILGPGSMFALDGEEHRRQRKLLVPPFHGKRLGAYEALIEEEAVKAMSSWPDGVEFPVLDSMMQITLNAILRAVFGAEGDEFEELRELLPRFVDLGARLAVLPVPKWELFGYGPWARFRSLRSQYDAVIARLVEKAEADPALSDRDDVLAMMLQSTYDDGSRMELSDIADELLTMLTAGHETTATSLAWAVERLRRHPETISRLAEEIRQGGSSLREATITEVQRTRPVIEATGRQARIDGAPLGRWILPKGMIVVACIGLMHENDELFPNAQRFYPERFVDSKVDPYKWIPFGGGVRRCIGAAFAQMEMTVVLRTLIRDFELVATTAPDESWHSRGIAYAPGDGGLAVVRRRQTPLGDERRRSGAPELAGV